MVRDLETQPPLFRVIVGGAVEQGVVEDEHAAGGNDGLDQPLHGFRILAEEEVERCAVTPGNEAGPPRVLAELGERPHARAADGPLVGARQRNQCVVGVEGLHVALVGFDIQGREGREQEILAESSFQYLQYVRLHRDLVKNRIEEQQSSGSQEGVVGVVCEVLGRPRGLGLDLADALAQGSDEFGRRDVLEDRVAVLLDGLQVVLEFGCLHGSLLGGSPSVSPNPRQTAINGARFSPWAAPASVRR